MVEMGLLELMHVNHSARSEGIIGVYFKCSLICRYVVCSHWNGDIFNMRKRNSP